MIRINPIFSDQDITLKAFRKNLSQKWAKLEPITRLSDSFIQ